MTWFNYLSENENSTLYPSVRRKINFPISSENLKIGDWIYVSLSDYQIGLTYSALNGEIIASVDPDSYLVVYENPSTSQFDLTYSYIDQNNVLWFKSVTDLQQGSSLSGSYYVYYHSNNIQYIQKVNSNYKRSSVPNGQNYMAKESGSEINTVDKYSNVVLGTAQNQRVSTISYLSSYGIWEGQSSDAAGNKAIGIFDGPLFQLYGTKDISGGKFSLKIIKTSSSGLGQYLVKSTTIDLFSPSKQEDVLLFSFDAKQEIAIDPTEQDQQYRSVLQEEQYNQEQEFYGSFLFEVEILNEKNTASSGKNVKITKYKFSKNYYLSLGDEEIYSGISFISSGVVR